MVVCSNATLSSLLGGGGGGSGGSGGSGGNGGGGKKNLSSLRI